MVSRLREVSLEVFLLSLRSVSGSELRLFWPCRIIYLQIRAGTKNMVPKLREVTLEVFLLSLRSVSGSELRFLACRIVTCRFV